MHHFIFSKLPLHNLISCDIKLPIKIWFIFKDMDWNYLAKNVFKNYRIFEGGRGNWGTQKITDDFKGDLKHQKLYYLHVECSLIYKISIIQNILKKHEPWRSFIISLLSVIHLCLSLNKINPVTLATFWHGRWQTGWPGWTRELLIVNLLLLISINKMRILEINLIPFESASNRLIISDVVGYSMYISAS